MQLENQVPPNKAGVIGVGFVLAMAVLALVIAGLTVNSTQPIRTQGAAFLENLNTESYADAFELLSLELREQLGSPNRLESYIVGGDHQIARQQLTSTNINGNRGAVTGVAEFEVDGGERRVFLGLERDGEVGWRIYSIQFNTMEMNDVANDLEEAAQAASEPRFFISDELPLDDWVLRGDG